MKRYLTMVMALFVLCGNIFAQDVDDLMDKYEDEKGASSENIPYLGIVAMKTLGKMISNPEKMEKMIDEKAKENNLSEDSVRIMKAYLRDSLQLEMGPILFFDKYDISSMKMLSLDSCSQSVKERFGRDAAAFHPEGYTLFGKTKGKRAYGQIKKGVMRRVLVLSYSKEDRSIGILKGKFPVSDVDNKEIGNLYNEFKQKKSVQYYSLYPFIMDFAAVDDSMGIYRGITRGLVLDLQESSETIRESFKNRMEQFSLTGFQLVENEEMAKDGYKLMEKRDGGTALRELLIYNDSTSPCLIYFAGDDIRSKNLKKLIEEILEE